MNRRLIGVLIGIAVLAGCGPIQPGGQATPDVTSPVDGVVIAVDATGIGDVRGFTLRTDGGFAFDFVLGQLEDPTSFAPGHLAEHQATSTPVRVYFRLEDGRRVVYRLEDAPD